MKVYFLFLLLLLIYGCKPATDDYYPVDELTIESNCTSTNLTVGEIAQLTITATFPTNSVIQMPEIGRKKQIIQTERNWDSIIRADGLQQSKFYYKITSFELGSHLISTNPIFFAFQNKTNSYPFPKIEINVESCLPEDANFELAPIREIRKLKSKFPKWISILILTSIIAYALGRLSIAWWKKKNHKKSSPPAIPAHLIALKELEKLYAGPLMKKECSASFVTAISLILRRYLEARFHLNAPDQTTEEIFNKLKESPILSDQQQKILTTFLQQADIVKFAKGSWEINAMEDAFNTTRNFIQDTAEYAEGEKS